MSLKIILFTFIVWTQILFAQDLSQDLGFIETHYAQGTPFNIPLYVDLAGNININTSVFFTGASFNFLGHVAYQASKRQYIRPIQRSEFSLDQQTNEMGWIEVKRMRWGPYRSGKKVLNFDEVFGPRK